MIIILGRVREQPLGGGIRGLLGDSKVLVLSVGGGYMGRSCDNSSNCTIVCTFYVCMLYFYIFYYILYIYGNKILTSKANILDF